MMVFLSLDGVDVHWGDVISCLVAARIRDYKHPGLAVDADRLVRVVGHHEFFVMCKNVLVRDGDGEFHLKRDVGAVNFCHVNMMNLCDWPCSVFSLADGQVLCQTSEDFVAGRLANAEALSFIPDSRKVALTISFVNPVLAWHAENLYCAIESEIVGNLREASEFREDCFVTQRPSFL